MVRPLFADLKRAVSSDSVMFDLRARRRVTKARGFTLTELMVVVAIVGILAVIGVSLMREYVFTSRGVEASSMVQSIRAAQERWRSETGAYFDVSTAITSWYPMATPNKFKYDWTQTGGNNRANWQLLNPTVNGPVQFGYATKAGQPGIAVTALTIQNPPAFPLPTEPWYVIQAWGDTDGDSIPVMFAATSFTAELFSQNEGE